MGQVKIIQPGAEEVTKPTPTCCQYKLSVVQISQKCNDMSCGNYGCDDNHCHNAVSYCVILDLLQHIMGSSLEGQKHDLLGGGNYHTFLQFLLASEHFSLLKLNILILHRATLWGRSPTFISIISSCSSQQQQQD